MHHNTHYRTIIRRNLSSQSIRRATNRKIQNSKIPKNVFIKFQPGNEATTPFETNSSPSLTNLASEYFTSLRLKAVSILSDSLSSTNRNKLLHSLQAIDKRTGEDTTRKSIGEAVASALAGESLKQDKVWKEKEENITTMAEQAAMERIKSDLQLMQQKEEENAQQRQHPVLGNMVADLGYKRLFITSAKVLSAIPVWEKQRIYRHDRAKVMATDKLKKKDVGTLAGVIALHEDANGQLSILDGQHRIGMMTLLLQAQRHNSKIGFDLNQILVEVFPSSNSAKELFVEINKAEPVKLVDMPGIAKPMHHKIINDVAPKLQEMYPDMFRPSQRCRSPHVNIDNLRDAVFAADVIEKFELKNGADLLEWILKKNKGLGDSYRTREEGGASSAAIEKAIKFDFYLGLDSSWLYK